MTRSVAREAVIYRGNGIPTARSPLSRDCPRCGAQRGYRCWVARHGRNEPALPLRRQDHPHRERQTHRRGPSTKDGTS